MKLVELLAEKIKEWPNGAKNITQDHDGSVSPCTDPHNDLEFDGSRWSSTDGFNMGIDIIGKQDLASDYKKAIVTRAQWQAERDRQKGGEWIRNRGNSKKAPVDIGTMVEVRFRNGLIEQDNGYPRWHHDGKEFDIMAYRVISQPQAEHGLELVQGVQDAVISCISHNNGAGKVTHGPIMMGDEVVGEASPEWHKQAKWDQIETPFKWRDEVTELNAYIEKYTRERDALIERLASEGFALIPPVVSVVSEFSGADMSDWRNWKPGDIVASITNCKGQFSVGSEYEIEEVHDGRIEIVADDSGDRNGWGVDNFKFIHHQ